MKDDAARAALSQILDALAALREMAQLSDMNAIVAPDERASWENAFSNFEWAVTQAGWLLTQAEVPA